MCRERTGHKVRACQNPVIYGQMQDMATPSTPAQYVLILIDLVCSRGHSRAQLLAGTTLAHTGVESIGARVPQSDFTQLVRNALRLSGDAALGLALGERLNLSAHAVLGQAFMTCRDLAQVLELFMQYYHLLSPELELQLAMDEQQCTVSTLTVPEADLREFSAELMAASFLNTLRGLLGREDLPLQLDFPYPEPAHSAAYSQRFGSALRFDCSHARIHLPRALLHSPLPSSNPALRELYTSECARLLADLEDTDSVVEQTLRLLRKLEGQYPQLPQLALMLNLSPRTLRRRLAAEGFAFRDLLDRVRAEHANRYLQHTRLPLSSIAYLTGFSDASNFRRAYKRWRGHSPLEERRRARSD